MSEEPDQIAAMIVATSFAAGLNVPATILTLGALANFGALTLPPALQLLGHPWVIAVSAVLFVIEFFADKIPGFDLVWNAAQTFIRVPAGALLAYGASSNLSPAAQLAAATAGGVIALIAHGGKTAARAAVTTSPEPLTNMLLSAGEDALSIGVVWLATNHPYIAAALVAAIVVSILAFLRWVVRALARVFGLSRHDPVGLRP
jgi:hypothetical protein